MMTNYKAVTKGVNGYRELIPEDKVDNRLMELYEKYPKSDFYVSIFKYNQKHFDNYKKTKTLAGTNDNVSNTIVFDFDDDGSLVDAKNDAYTVVNRLIKAGLKKEDIGIYFSGGKGIHVEIKTDKDFTKDELVNIRTNISGDLNTTDPVIKDNQRILRAVFSTHPDTGLCKIPLLYNELATMSVEDIKKEAAHVSDARYEMHIVKTVTLPTTFNEYSKAKKADKTVKSVEAGDKPDFAKNKTGLTNAKYALSEGYFEEGERHEAVMILASTFMGLGWNKEITYNNLKATLRLRARRLGLDDVSELGKEELWRDVESVYSVLWRGGMYAEDTNELLIKTKKRYNIEDKYDKNLMVTLPQVNSIFSDFATNIDKNTLKLGIPSFDKEVRVTTSTLVALLAAPSAGKSSISFGILNSTSNDGIKSMFFSLDMAAPQVFQRLAQRHTGYHSDRLFSAYQTRDSAVIEKVEKTLSEQYKNVKFCFRGAMNVDIIRDAILKEKELTGEFPKLVVIDYLENIMTDLSNDPTIAKGFVARSLKDMANEFAICVLLLVQPAKVSGTPAQELNSYYAIKGSGVVAECAAQVLTLHRPGFDPKNPSDDNFISLTVVKNRMGSLGSFDYHWEGVRGSIRELTSDEQNTLKTLREQNAAAKIGDGL